VHIFAHSLFSVSSFLSLLTPKTNKKGSKIGVRTLGRRNRFFWLGFEESHKDAAGEQSVVVGMVIFTNCVPSRFAL
jgi:hypothetical protein